MSDEVAVLVVLKKEHLEDLKFLQKRYDAEWSEIIRVLVRDRRMLVQAVETDEKRNHQGLASMLEVQRRQVTLALAEARGDTAKAAALVGMDVQGFRGLMGKVGVSRPEPAPHVKR